MTDDGFPPRRGRPGVTDDGFARCKADGCEAKVKNHKWGKIHAVQDGWFFGQHPSADPPIWCPDHLPEWVESWRARKAGARP